MPTEEEITDAFSELENLSEQDLNKQTGKLTARQEAFCWAYLTSLNATKAAIQAGYAPEYARQQGYENLTKPYITDRITTLRQQMAGKFDISKESLIQELATIAKFDLREVYSEDGTLLPVNQWSEEAGKALAGVEVDEIKEYDPDSETMKIIGYTKKVKRDNKIGAIAELNKMLGYNAPVKSDVNVNLTPIIIDWNENDSQQPATDQV